MNQARLYSIILGPHISEKATIMAEDHNQVVFKVCNDANKTEIKQAIWKKAYVQLAQGQEIDFAEMS